MAADKVQSKALGEAFVAFIVAIGDGVDVVGDAPALMALVSAAVAAADDVREDTDAAIAYAISGASEAFGDRKAG